MQYCHQISHVFGAFFCKQSRLILKFTRMRHKNYQGTLRSKSGYEDVDFQTTRTVLIFVPRSLR